MDGSWAKTWINLQSIRCFSSALQNISGTTSDSAAWRMIFQFHNNTRGKGTVNYKTGEKIFIKMNATSGWSGNFNTSGIWVSRITVLTVFPETSEATVLAVFKQLVNVVGVAQVILYIGDPMKHMYKHLYDVMARSISKHPLHLITSYSTIRKRKSRHRHRRRSSIILIREPFYGRIPCIRIWSNRVLSIQTVSTQFFERNARVYVLRIFRR